MLKFLAKMGTRKRSTQFRWAFAVGALFVAVMIRAVMASNLPPGFPFLTFFPAVIFTTFLCGLWPGTAVAVASGLAAWFFFIPPFNTFALDGPAGLALAFYALIVGVDIVVIHVMNMALGNLEVERGRSQRLAESLDVMFKELQHRISNNLQVVSGLMYVQKRYVQDDDARRILDEAATRLALIGKIHRELHDPSGQTIDFGLFLKGLCHDVIEAAGAGTNIVCLVRSDAVEMGAERTIPAALIVAELISNALEHAFTSQQKGSLSVDLTYIDGLVTIIVEDDGAGLAPGFDLATSPSLGLTIIKALATQIEGVFAMVAGGHYHRRGTTCSLSFPLNPSTGLQAAE